MSWIIFKSFLKKSWVWLKEHWQMPFLLVWTIVVYVLAKRNSDALLETMEAKKESYKKQIEVLRKSHNDEILARNKLTKEYEQALKEIEDRYKKKQEDLSEVEKNEIKEVVIKSKGNPDEIVERIKKEFAIKFMQ